MSTRAQLEILNDRLQIPRRYLQVLAVPRQAGKTTLARQAMSAFAGQTHYASADLPATPDAGWIEQQWRQARLQAGAATPPFCAGLHLFGPDSFVPENDRAVAGRRQYDHAGPLPRLAGRAWMLTGLDKFAGDAARRRPTVYQRLGVQLTLQLRPLILEQYLHRLDGF